MLDGELSNIEALKELRAELKQLRDVSDMPAKRFCGAYFTFSLAFLSLSTCALFLSLSIYALSLSLAINALFLSPSSLLYFQGFHFELIEDLQRTVYTWSTYSSQPSALTNIQQLPHLPHHSENGYYAYFPAPTNTSQLILASFFPTVRGLPATSSSPASKRKGCESTI